MKFKKYNCNPKGANTKDCAIRAIATALGQSWEDTMIGLAQMSCTTGFMPNSTITTDKYIKEMGWERTDVRNRTLNSMRFRGTHIVRLYKKGKSTGHMTYVKDGVLIDTWNCSGWKVDYYYTIKK